MGRTAYTQPQCLYKGALYLTSVPVQGCTVPYLSACTRVHCTLPQCMYKGALYLTSVPVQGCTVPYLSACTMVHCTLPQCLYKGALYLTSVPVQGCTVPYLSACTRTHCTLPQCLYKGDLYLKYKCSHNLTQEYGVSHLKQRGMPNKASLRWKFEFKRPLADRHSSLSPNAYNTQ